VERLKAELEAGRYALPALLVAMAFAAVYLIWVTRGAGFYLDEWNFINDRLELSADSLLRPYVDNLIAIPLLVYEGAFKIFGLGGAHLPIRVVWAGCVLACSLLLFLYLRRRTLAWVAFIPSCLLLAFGAAWTDQATSVGLVRLSSVAAGLGSLVALDRRTPRADLFAAVLLITAVLSHSAALPFVVGAAVTVALRGKPEGWRSAWIWATPLVIYFIWAVWARISHPGSPIDVANIAKVPQALLDGNATVLAGAAGRYVTNDAGRIYKLDHDPGLPLVGLLAAWIAFLAVRRRFPREALVGLSMLLSYWLLVALVISPVRQPTSDRYLYVGAVLLAITVAPLIPRRSPPLLGWAAIAAALVVFSLAPNIRALSQAAENVEEATDETRAGLAAIELARDRVPKGFKANNAVPEFEGGLYLPRSAGPYLAAVDHYGSPALSEKELIERDDEARRVADAVLAGALNLHLATKRHAFTGRSRCGPHPTEAGGSVQVAPPVRIGLVPMTAAGTEVTAARFADNADVSLGRIPSGREATLAIPRDRSTWPWRLQVTGATRVTLCRHQTPSTP
jgi:hypothetical protein